MLGRTSNCHAPMSYHYYVTPLQLLRTR